MSAAAWTDALQALALFATDPSGLGGIALRAGPGPVRDRFLQNLQDLLPPGTPLRRLPLNTADDRLLGGLDLAATLQSGRPIAQKGLLAEADGGVVILAMAERIDPAAVARLCAVLDNAEVTLQRDGLSRTLPARVGIVALDEGADPDEHPAAALLDRIAFHVDLSEVSVRDLDQDIPGASTLPDYEEATPAPEIDAIEALCHAALALGIDSSRAPVFALRAARAAAGQQQLSESHVGLAARLVLAPRATRFPPPQDAEPPPNPEPPENPEPPLNRDPPENPEPPQEPETPPPNQETPPPDPENLPNQPLEDVVLEAALAALPPDLLARLALASKAAGLARAPGRAGQFKASVKRGRPIGTRQGEPKAGARLHLLETLKTAAPWQTLRRRPTHPGRFEVRREDFRIIRFRQRIGTTTIFAVDASGSAAMARLGEAKGAVELLLADCYVRRDQVALLSFRGQGATLLLPPTGSLLRAKRCLAGLPGGGPTPLAAGIEAALTLAATIRRSGRTPVITLLTDARANILRDGTGGRPQAEAEAMEAARALAAARVATLLVDTSPRPNPFARRLAEEMRAHYVPLPYADASTLSRAVRAASEAPPPVPGGTAGKTHTGIAGKTHLGSAGKPPSRAA